MTVSIAKHNQYVAQ